MYFIVRCSDSSYCTGITRGINKRIWHHNNSELGAKSLIGKRPVKLVYPEKYLTKSRALKRENEIKGWRRVKKIKLIESLH